MLLVHSFDGLNWIKNLGEQFGLYPKIARVQTPPLGSSLNLSISFTGT